MRVLIADDHTIMREGLRHILKDAGVHIVAEANDGRETIDLVATHGPDIVLMDIGMPRLNGVEATRRITREYPDTRVLALSAFSEKHQVLSMLKAGAAGYLVKDTVGKELIDALHAVGQGKKYLSPTVAGVVVDGLMDGSAPQADGESLGSREREVLQLLAEGHTSAQIARQLHISLSTVDTHRRNIMKKLDLHNVAELTKYAVREGLTQLG